jgi:hypothetical protein
MGIKESSFGGKFNYSPPLEGLGVVKKTVIENKYKISRYKKLYTVPLETPNPVDSAKFHALSFFFSHFRVLFFNLR